MQELFVGKVAVVTGAGRGIGRDTALLFARLGAKVVINDLGGEPTGDGGSVAVAQTVVDEIVAAGGEAVAETSSVATMAGGKAVVEKALDTYGRLDFLVNNAGILRPKRVWDMTEADFDLVIAVNLKSHFATVKAAAEALKKQGGAIVNISSPSGFGHYGMSNYSASKEGVVGFTRSIAREFGEFGVRCNAVRPATGVTRMGIPEVLETLDASVKLGIPMNSNQYYGFGEMMPLPEHVAAAIVWLCSPHAEPLSGKELWIIGSQVALVQEPELIRSQFKPGGWTFEALASPEVTLALTYDQRNRYTGKDVS